MKPLKIKEHKYISNFTGSLSQYLGKEQMNHEVIWMLLSLNNI